MTLFIQQTLNGIAIGSAYSIFALGFALLYSTMNLLNVAHGTYATWGAIITLMIVTKLDQPFIVALVGGLICSGLIGYFVDQFAFQPLRTRKSESTDLMISSIGCWIVLGNLARMATKATWLTFPSSSFPRTLFTFAGLKLSFPHLILIITSIVVSVFLYFLVQKSRFGASMRAVGYDPRYASLSGINPRLVIIISTFLSASIAGLAGVLSGISTNNVSFTLGESLFLKGFAAVLIGGYDDYRGALIGGWILGITEILGAQYISNTFRDAFGFGLLVLFLLLRPTGIFGQKGRS
jgi:branched-chain amino acid transport system permease protein